MRRTLQQAGLIILLGVTLGLAGNQLSPRGLPLIAAPKPVPVADEFIALDQAKKLWQSGAAIFLDAREPADFAAGHIGNALNLPAQSFEQHFPEMAPILAAGLPLIIYCDGTECDLSHRLKKSLQQVGYTNTYLLSNGWTAWRQAGLPTGSGGSP